MLKRFFIIFVTGAIVGSIVSKSLLENQTKSLVWLEKSKYVTASEDFEDQVVLKFGQNPLKYSQIPPSEKKEIQQEISRHSKAVEEILKRSVFQLNKPLTSSASVLGSEVFDQASAGGRVEIFWPKPLLFPISKEIVSLFPKISKDPLLSFPLCESQLLFVDSIDCLGHCADVITQFKQFEKSGVCVRHAMHPTSLSWNHPILQAVLCEANRNPKSYVSFILNLKKVLHKQRNNKNLEESEIKMLEPRCSLTEQELANLKLFSEVISTIEIPSQYTVVVQQKSLTMTDPTLLLSWQKALKGL